MTKMYCGHCGAENDGTNKFCIYCGAPLGNRGDRSRDAQPHGDGFGSAPHDTYGSRSSDGFGSAPHDAYGTRSSDGFGSAPHDAYGSRSGAVEEEIIYTSVAPRSIALSVILTILTCGIYGLYWMYKLNNEINELAQDPMGTGGGMVLFLTIVTFGIYGLFWLYRMGQKCDYIRQANTSSGILYLILGILGLSIVAYALMQETINRVLE